MSDSERLERIEQDVREMKGMLSRVVDNTPRIVPAYEHRPMTVDEVVIDGKTINKDGSIWTYDTTGRYGDGTPGKVPVQLHYGYFSKEKEPEAYAKCVELFGDHFLQWDAQRDKWSLYRASPVQYVMGGAANWITLMNMFLSPYGRHEQ